MPPKTTIKSTTKKDKNPADLSDAEFAAAIAGFHSPDQPKFSDLETKKKPTAKEKAATFKKEKIVLHQIKDIETTAEDEINYEELLLFIYNQYAAIYVPSKIQDNLTKNWHHLDKQYLMDLMKFNIKAVRVQKDEVERFIHENFAVKVAETIRLAKDNMKLLEDRHNNDMLELYHQELGKIQDLLKKKNIDQETEELIIRLLDAKILSGKRANEQNKILNLHDLLIKISYTVIRCYGNASSFPKLIDNLDFLEGSKKSYSADIKYIKYIKRYFIDIVAAIKEKILEKSPEDLKLYLQELLQIPVKTPTIIAVNRFDLPKFHQEAYNEALEAREKKTKEINKKFDATLKALNEARRAVYKASNAFRNAQKALRDYESLLQYSAKETSDSEENLDVTEAFIHLKKSGNKSAEPQHRENKEESGLNDTQIAQLTKFLQGRNFAVLNPEILNNPNINHEILIGIKRSYEALENIYVNCNADLSSFILDNQILTPKEYDLMQEACLTQNLRNFFKGQTFSVNKSGAKQVNIQANQIANLLMHNPHSLTLVQKQNIANIIKTAADQDVDLANPNFIAGILQEINQAKIINCSAKVVSPDHKQQVAHLSELFDLLKKFQQSEQIKTSFTEYDVVCSNLMNDFGMLAQTSTSDGKDFLNLCKDYRDFVSHGSDKNFAVKIRKYNQDGNVLLQRRLDQIAGMANIKERDSALQEFYLDKFKEKITAAQNINDLVDKESLMSKVRAL